MFTETGETPPPQDGARQLARKEQQQAKRDAQKKAQPASAVAQKKTPGARGKNWTYPEKLCGVYAVTAVNAQFCDGSPQKERYVHYNAVYGKEAERMWKNGEWVDQHGRAEDKITPEQSILERPTPPCLRNCWARQALALRHPLCTLARAARVPRRHFTSWPSRKPKWTRNGRNMTGCWGAWCSAPCTLAPLCLCAAVRIAAV